MSINRKLGVFLTCAAGAALLASFPLSDLVLHGRPGDYYKHIPLIPVISAFVLIKRRRKLFGEEPRSPGWGGALIGLGLVLLAIDFFRKPAIIAHAELVVLGALSLIYGSYLALFGRRSFVRALFPFLFLAFMVPLPIAWMDRVVSVLVAGSMGATHLLFRAFRVPFVQEGSIFRLPAFDLEVAQECSGIRSSIALLITSVLAGQIFLEGRWRKIVLALAVFPVTVFKNGIRIVTLYLLSYFIDMRIIDKGFLHRSGGFLFFGLGLAILAVILWWLREGRHQKGRSLI